eukprot:10015689-Prorocentrum_lima.AAC.1
MPHLPPTTRGRRDMALAPLWARLPPGMRDAGNTGETTEVPHLQGPDAWRGPHAPQRRPGDRA